MQKNWSRRGLSFHPINVEDDDVEASVSTLGLTSYVFEGVFTDQSVPVSLVDLEELLGKLYDLVVDLHHSDVYLFNGRGEEVGYHTPSSSKHQHLGSLDCLVFKKHKSPKNRSLVPIFKFLKVKTNDSPLFPGHQRFLGLPEFQMLLRDILLVEV